MEIERLWGKEPGWIDTLPHESQVKLLGWYRVFRAPTGKPQPPKPPQRSQHRR